jgi:hypothetical protein
MANSPNLSTCAVPFCPNTWRRMGEGKLFVFQMRNHSSSKNEVKNVWLCEDCLESWDVILDKHGHVQLQPLQRMAS